MNYPASGYNPAQQQYPPQAPVHQQPQYPGYPQAPQQGYPPQAAPQYPQQGGYPQVAPPQQPPAPPLAAGSIDAFYNQPSVGGGPSISWSDKQGSPKPIGTTYGGVVARDVTNADIQQQTDMKSGVPLNFRDGRPKFAMKVPLKVQQSPDFPDGEATWFVKGQARDELARAMAEAGDTGAPKAGAVIVVTLVQRRPSGPGMNPANIVQVSYQRPDGGGAQAPATVRQPIQQAPMQQQVPQGQPLYQQPVQGQPVQGQPVQGQPVQGQPVQQYEQQPQYQQAPAQQVQQPVQQQAPAQAAPPQAPADFNAQQAELLARLTGQPQPLAQAG